MYFCWDTLSCSETCICCEISSWFRTNKHTDTSDNYTRSALFFCPSVGISLELVRNLRTLSTNLHIWIRNSKVRSGRWPCQICQVILMHSTVTSDSSSGWKIHRNSSVKIQVQDKCLKGTKVGVDQIRQ